MKSKKYIIILSVLFSLGLLMQACGKDEKTETEKTSYLEQENIVEENYMDKAPETETSVESASEESDEEIVTDAIEESAPQISKNYVFDKHSYEFETYGGYKIEAILNISRWIKASDINTLNEAWASLGNTDESPSIDSFNRKGSTMFRSDNSVIAFGNITFENKTEGYDITPDVPVKIDAGSCFMNININMDYSAGAEMGTISQPEMRIYYDGNVQEETVQASFSPTMESNQWGPVNCAIAIGEIFNPKYPDGSPALDRVTIRFGEGMGNYNDDKVFDIGKDW